MASLDDNTVISPLVTDTYSDCHNSWSRLRILISIKKKAVGVIKICTLTTRPRPGSFQGNLIYKGQHPSAQIYIVIWLFGETNTDLVSLLQASGTLGASGSLS